MNDKPRFTGHCLLDGMVLDVKDEPGKVRLVGEDETRAIFSHVASAMMQYLSRPAARPGDPAHLKITKQRNGQPPKAEGPIIIESEAAKKFLEYRMLLYVGSSDPRLEAYRQQLRAEVLEAVDHEPYPSPGSVSGIIPPE